MDTKDSGLKNVLQSEGCLKEADELPPLPPGSPPRAPPPPEPSQVTPQPNESTLDEILYCPMYGVE